MELSDEQKKVLAKEAVPNFNHNNWARYEGSNRAWAEANLADAPFVEEGEDIFKRKDIFL